MRIALITHPSFMASQSMPRYAQALKTGFEARGIETSLIAPAACLSKMKVPAVFRKWLGYADQYVIFPRKLKQFIRRQPSDTIFVITDNALGPYVPYVAARPHMIHCHDFIAQKSACGQIPEVHISFTGRIYQRYIRNGYCRGRNFICISRKTKEDLLGFLDKSPAFCEVLYNCMNRDFKYESPAQCLPVLQRAFPELDFSKGYWLHVGGNQWYKNRKGVIAIFEAYKKSGGAGQLLLIGEAPDEALDRLIRNAAFRNDIIIGTGISDGIVDMAYCAASLLLFPSVTEGFGWPIAEAMKLHCPVVTTDAAPMNEVGGDAAVYIPVKPPEEAKEKTWAQQAALIIQKEITEASREKIIAEGLRNVERFAPAPFFNQLICYYEQILKTNNQ